MDSASVSVSSNAKTDKPLHVVMLPWLAMGHVYPCLELSKILAQKGHYVTLLSTPTILDRLPKLPQSLLPFVKLTKLPLSPHIDKNHLPQDADSTMDIPSNKLYYLKLAFDGLQDSVSEVLKISNPDWVFFDFGASWLPQLASTLHIRCAYFSPCPAWSICFFDTPKQQLGDVAAATRTNPEDYYGPPKWVSFPTKIGLRPHEVKKLFEDVKLNETGASPVFDLNRANSGCDMFVIRSSRDLEPEWLDYLAEFYHKPVIPVGLLPPSMQVSDSDDEKNSPDWLQIKVWLDTQQGSSVVYIAFGSEVKLSQENLNELALGIELSGLPFFWVLRSLHKGLVQLPNGFEDRTKERGVVWTTWAPQPRILAHASVGGCLTHCGSGSMIENLYFGHVLVMLPFLLDQALYSRVMEEKKVGIEIPRNEQDGSFTRSSVAKALRLAMVDEEGSALRKNAKEMGKKFSNREVHNQYIENFIASLHNH
ncbi:soyasaponin III rhamnosyltransferase-like [Abrus precatorius]|uniref:Soyasaponin III rhamnosyltransferase-like n=1 Tax=Abrus precatorius TaxID=3816 RepID=A0A8B8K6D4_ABRPR|nr:soyasaponin III rhamnosyltransferase-like [Abrus precatorius]